MYQWSSMEVGAPTAYYTFSYYTFSYAQRTAFGNFKFRNSVTFVFPM